MLDHIQKAITKTDDVFNSIPIPVYVISCLVLSLFIGQATYDYVTQEQPINFSINVSRAMEQLTANNYGGDAMIREMNIKVCDSSSIVSGNNNSPICYDKDLFYSTGKLEVNK